MATKRGSISLFLTDLEAYKGSRHVGGYLFCSSRWECVMLSIYRTLCILATGAYIKSGVSGRLWVVSRFAFYLRFASILLWCYLRGRQNVLVRRRGVKVGAMGGVGGRRGVVAMTTACVIFTLLLFYITRCCSGLRMGPHLHEGTA